MATRTRTSRRLPFEPKRRESKWDNPNKEKYDSNWRKYSKNFRGKNRECYWCNKVIIDIKDSVCDHVIPVIHGGSWMNELNHGAMHRGCHNAKSAMEKNGPIYDWKLDKEGKKIPTRGVKFLERRKP